MSALSWCPHSVQQNSDCETRLFCQYFHTNTHQASILGINLMNIPPRQSCLYSNCRRNSPQPWSSIDLFNPDFVCDIFPGSSIEPFGRSTHFVIFKSSTRSGWGEFRRQLEYKQDWRGGIFIKVDPKYTSLMCVSCGNIDKNNRVSQSEFLLYWVWASRQCWHSCSKERVSGGGTPCWPVDRTSLEVGSRNYWESEVTLSLI